MVCLTCHVATTGRLCHDCVATLRPAAERILPGGIRLVASFEHEGAARGLMHLLKYRGLLGYADLVADLLVDRLPVLPLVPVPRAISRRVRYGVDPARAIARAISRRNDAQVLNALLPPLHTLRRAGRDHTRSVRGFGVWQTPSTAVILVDDVVTTGSTVMAAAGALGAEHVRLVAAANVTSLTFS